MPRAFVPSLILLLCCLGVYCGSLRNELIYDDHEVIQAHEGPRNLSDVAQLFRERHFPSVPYYRPLTRTTLLLQKSVSGENPLPFHLFNILLAGIAGTLAFALLRVSPFQFDAWKAWLAAAFFVLHPIASSCVYPVSSGRETLMPAVWVLACVYCWLRSGWMWRTAASACLAAALLSKEQAVILPLLLMLADCLGLPAERTRRSLVTWLSRYAPLAAILVAYIAVRHMLFGGSEYTPGYLWGPFLAVLYALQTIFTPFLALHYEPSLQTWLSAGRLIAAVGCVLVLVWLCIRGRMERNIAWFWGGWFLIALLPNSNLIRQEAQFDERYVFLASFAIFAAVARVLPERRNWQVAAICLLLISAFATASRARAFQNDRTFSEQWLRTEPSSVNAEYNLAWFLARQDDLDGAIEHYRRAISLRPDYTFAHNNLANVLVRAGREADAIPHFREALRLDPTYFDAWYNLGLALCATGSQPECVTTLRKASVLRPGNSAVLINLGNALAQSGDPGGAATAFERALQIEPNSAEAHGNYANVLARMGNFNGAISHYRQALALNPNLTDAARNLQTVLSYQAR